MGEQTLSFRIRAIDDMSGPMARIAVITQAAMAKVSASVARAIPGPMTGSATYTPFMKMASAAFTAWSPVIGAITSGLGKLLSVGTSVFGKLVSWVKDLVSGFISLAARIGATILKLGALGTVAATAVAGLLARSFLAAAREMESFRAKLQVAMKSDVLADFMLQWSEAKAIETPFDLSAVTDAVVVLQLYSLNAKEWFDTVGDAAGAMGTDVTDAVFAITAALRGEWEPIRRYGITSATLMRAGAKGDASGLDIRTDEGLASMRKALKTVLDERFAGGMKKLMNTIQGAESNLRDVVYKIRASLGAALAPAFRRILAALTDAGGKLVPLIRSWQKGLSEFLDGAVKKAIDYLPKLGEKLKPVVEWLRRAGAAFGDWFAGMGGFAGIWNRLRASVASLWSFVTQTVGPVFEWLFRTASFWIGQLAVWLDGQGGLAGVWERLVAFGQNLLGLYRAYIAPALAFFAENLKVAFEILTTGLAEFSNRTGGLEGFVKVLSEIIVAVAKWLPVLAEQFVNLTTVILPGLKIALEDIVAALTAIADVADRVSSSGIGRALGLGVQTRSDAGRATVVAEEEAASGRRWSLREKTARMRELEAEDNAKLRADLARREERSDKLRRMQLDVKLQPGLMGRDRQQAQYVQQVTYGG